MTPDGYPKRQTISDPLRDLGHGLYAFGAAFPQLAGLFLLTRNDPPEVVPTSLLDFWGHGFGWAIFSPTDLSQGDVASFAEAARKSLPAVGEGADQQPTMFVWLTNPDDTSTFASAPHIGFLSQGGGSPAYALATSTSTIADTRLALTFTETTASVSSSLTLQDGENGGPASITFVVSPENYQLDIDGDRFVDLSLALYPAFTSPTAVVCNIALEGPQTGSFGVPLGLDYGTLGKMFGMEPYFQYIPSEIEGPDGTASAALTTLRMPLYQPQVAQTTNKQKFSAFNVLLSLFHPGNPQASGIFLDRAGRLLSGSTDKTTDQYQQVQNTLAMTSPYGSFSNGAVMTLVPGDPLEQGLPEDLYANGGFSYSGPLDVADGKPPMMPAGTYVPVEGVHTTGAPVPATQAVSVMPGLFAKDFVQLAAGDLIGFEPGQQPFISRPANKKAQKNANAVVQKGTGTTSLPFLFKGASDTGRGYFGQSSSANLYLSTSATDGVLTAADALLSKMDAAPPFPVLWIGAALLSEGSTGPINPGLTATFIEKLEQKAFGPTRHGILYDLKETGPQVQLPANAKSVQPDVMAAVAAEPTHPVITPQGYVVDVSETTGVFTDITLGIGGEAPEIGQTALRFNGSGTPKQVDPEVSTLLTRENLFLVATEAEAKWHFQNHLLVDGFNFTVALDDPGKPTQRPSILIIKLDPRRTLREMSLDPTAWTDGDDYVSDASSVVSRLTALYAAAEKVQKDDDPFVAFRALLDRKSWTGVIAFEAPIDGNGMPPDLQMLLGGINGGLWAHHVGVDTNKIASDGSASVAQSSIFAVINYHDTSTVEPDGPGPFYKVGELVAVIANSKLVELNVTVELIMKTLLGRAVALQNVPSTLPANTLLIKGKYQKSGSVGHVVFTTDKPFVYDMVRAGDGTIRAIDSVHVTHASLVPISSDPDTDGPDKTETRVQANFTLGGQIFFDPSPFHMAPDFDLFSYGQVNAGPEKVTQGLNFGGLTVQVVFDLTGDTGALVGAPKVTLLEDSLTPTATPSAVRPESLLGTLPLKLTRFQVSGKDADGETVAVGQGGKSINILNLQAAPPNLKEREKLRKEAADGQNVAPLPMPVSPYTTNAPAYGLQYSVSLGSLGALSSAHAGITAAMTIAWGPSPTVPDNDAAALFIELPSLSAGYQGFDLQGFIKTKFEDANLLQVEVEDGRNVYAMSFDNVQLSVLGYALPPGVIVDFLLFSGNQGAQKVKDASSIGWLLSAKSKSDSDAEDA